MKVHQFYGKDRFTELKQELARPGQGNLWLGAAGMWFIIGSFLVIGLLPKSWSNDWHGWLITFGGVFAPAITLFAFASTADRKRTIPILRELANMDDPRVAGLFLWRMRSGSAYQMPELKQALIRLLPQMQRADAVHLPYGTQSVLHQLLSDPNDELVLAVLTALPQVGTIEALPYVELYAEGHGRASRSPRIQEVAQHCRAVLAERAEKVKMPDAVLLRASCAPASVDTLLRPVLPNADTEAASSQLLRPQV